MRGGGVSTQANVRITVKWFIHNLQDIKVILCFFPFNP